jgi:hypothetical protein
MKSKLLLALILSAGLAGCVERTLTITSTPPGALATVNSQEVGRTPVTIPFTWYGDYDIVLRLEDKDRQYQTLKTHYNVSPPAYEIPPFDLFSELVPWTYHVQKTASFELRPLVPPTDDELIQQAQKLRAKNLEEPK